MLHVEHRHVLVNHALHPRWVDRTNQIGQLITIQIIRCRQTLCAQRFDPLSRPMVGDVQRKIRDRRDAFAIKEP